MYKMIKEKFKFWFDNFDEKDVCFIEVFEKINSIRFEFTYKKHSCSITVWDNKTIEELIVNKKTLEFIFANSYPFKINSNNETLFQNSFISIKTFLDKM